MHRKTLAPRCRRRFQPSPIAQGQNNLVRKAAAEALGNIGSKAKTAVPRWSSAQGQRTMTFGWPLFGLWETSVPTRKQLSLF